MCNLKVKPFHNTFLQSCSYVLENDDYEHVYIVDCGDVQPLVDYIGKRKLKGIFLTHCHFDHVYGINDMLDIYPDTKCYCSKETFDGINDERASMSFMYVDDFCIKKKDNFCFVDEDSYKLVFNQQMHFLKTPGHDIDCVCYKIGEYIFTGDSYNPYYPVFTNWYRSNKEEAVKSENRIIQITERNRLKVFPGHFK